MPKVSAAVYCLVIVMIFMLIVVIITICSFLCFTQYAAC